MNTLFLTAVISFVAGALLSGAIATKITKVIVLAKVKIADLETKVAGYEAKEKAALEAEEAKIKGDLPKSL